MTLADEATPHLHIDFVPFTTGSKRGLETRVSLKKALGAQGFKGGTRGDTEWNQWVNAEKKHLAAVMLEHGVEWERLGTHEEHLSVLDYKKQERAKEVATLDAQAQALTTVVSERREQVAKLDQQKEQRQAEVEELDTAIVEKQAQSEKVEQTLGKLQEKNAKVSEIEAIRPKQIPLSGQVVLSKENYNTLVSGAEQFVIQKKKESKLQKLLDAANQTIEELKKTIYDLRAEIMELEKELSYYKSVRSQLNRGKTEAENQNLKREIQELKSVLQSYGIRSRQRQRNMQKKEDSL